MNKLFIYIPLDEFGRKNRLGILCDDGETYLFADGDECSADDYAHRSGVKFLDHNEMEEMITPGLIRLKNWIMGLTHSKS